ncbi:unnamed protein product, partial [Rotaria sp. Silwood2]
MSNNNLEAAGNDMLDDEDFVIPLTP